MDIDYKRIGRHLRAARKNKHLTQAEVSEKLNIAENTYSNMERGSQKPSLSRIIQLCEIYGIKPGIVLDDCTDDLITQIDSLYDDSTPDRQELHLLIDKCSDKTVQVIRIVTQSLRQALDEKTT